MQLTIGDIADTCLKVTPSTKCEEVYKTFKESPSLEGIVVCLNDRPIGLVMKTHFYQALSTKYGFNLFMNRTIDLVMNKESLMVDSSVPITDVSARAMNRSLEHLYDYVIVTSQGRIRGTVSIKNLLIKLTEVQVNIARNSNPLTGLPGNTVINETLQEALLIEKFSVLYIDIDSFKVFNDSYGFRKGDEVIRETANIIVETVRSYTGSSSFVGHIGGDDFIAVIHDFNYKEICQSIISRFDQMSRRFYNEKELMRGYVEAISRMGKLEHSPLISVSIAVVSNKSVTFQTVEQLSKEAANVKKKCKEIKYSVFLSLEDYDREFVS
ncbi:GGDEF domain-containing protein [Bacillus sp. 1P10SD]|uniref:GGDEF domain-containing protein n=1 Tax=Bacillus sp. 1P10SD TaxID=3132265 RepID=UPI0039A610A8